MLLLFSPFASSSEPSLFLQPSSSDVLLVFSLLWSFSKGYSQPDPQTWQPDHVVGRQLSIGVSGVCTAHLLSFYGSFFFFFLDRFSRTETTFLKGSAFAVGTRGTYLQLLYKSWLPSSVLLSCSTGHHRNRQTRPSSVGYISLWNQGSGNQYSGAVLTTAVARCRQLSFAISQPGTGVAFVIIHEARLIIFQFASRTFQNS